MRCTNEGQDETVNNEPIEFLDNSLDIDIDI
jgi:hypothetical protein